MANPALAEGFDLNNTNTTPLTASKISDGFIFEETVSSAVHNEMFKQLFAAVNKSKNDSVWDWETDVTYATTALVREGNKFYFALQSSNPDKLTPKQPSLEPTYWGLFYDLDQPLFDTFAKLADVYLQAYIDANFAAINGSATKDFASKILTAVDIVTSTLLVQKTTVDAHIKVQSNEGTYQYIRLGNNTDPLEWDIATKSTEQSAALQFRPNALALNAMILNKDGSLVVAGALSAPSVTVDSVTAKTTNTNLALAGNGTGKVTTDSIAATTTNANLALAGNGTGKVTANGDVVMATDFIYENTTGVGSYLLPSEGVYLIEVSPVAGDVRFTIIFSHNTSQESTARQILTSTTWYNLQSGIGSNTIVAEFTDGTTPSSAYIKKIIRLGDN